MFKFSFLKKRRSFLATLLSTLHVPFTDFHLNELIKLHPNSGNLLGVSDILYQYNVANLSLKIDHQDLLKIEPPFLVQLYSTRNQEFAVVTRVDTDHVEYFSEKGAKTKLIIDNFMKSWTGVVLLTETSEKSGEADLVMNQRKQLFAWLRLPLIITALLSYVAWFAYRNFTVIPFSLINYSILTLFYMLGSAVSVLLLIQTIDKSNPFVNKICALAKTNSHCSDVLDGPAAKFFGIISWSEVGFVFFVGNLLTLLFVPQVKDLMFWINVMALPYTIWSVYYQGKIAKQWCVFCLSIQVLLWFCFIGLLTTGISFSLSDLISIPYHDLLQTMFCFSLPVLGLWFAIPYIKKAQLLTPAMQELNKIKANENIFEAVLKTQKQVEINDDVKSIVFGNPEVSFVITMVTNPYCGPCARMHHKLEALLMQYGDFIQLNIIYAVGNHQPEENDNIKLITEKRNKAIRTLIAIYLKYGVEESLHIYKEWYAGAKDDIERFIKKYPVEINDVQTDKIISFHNEWCQIANIEATPTLYVNGCELPGWYNVDDLKYFIHQ